MKIHQITFNPTGGTRRASEYICEGSDTRPIVTDLCVKEGRTNKIAGHTRGGLGHYRHAYVCRTRTGLGCQETQAYSELPREVCGCGGAGNRAYNDAMLEMQDVATDMGYGKFSQSRIPAGSMQTFEIELLGIA